MSQDYYGTYWRVETLLAEFGYHCEPVMKTAFSAHHWHAEAGAHGGQSLFEFDWLRRSSFHPFYWAWHLAVWLHGLLEPSSSRQALHVKTMTEIPANTPCGQHLQ